MLMKKWSALMNGRLLFGPRANTRRTLSAVREAARGQVRMELKAAPAQRAVRCVGRTVPTDEAEREDDQPRGAQELEYEGPELTDGETLTGSFLVEPGANNEDQDGDGDGRGVHRLPCAE